MSTKSFDLLTLTMVWFSIANVFYISYEHFLAYLSWKLKWAILIARCPSFVYPSVHLFVCLSVNFYIFNFFSRTIGPILTKLGKNHPLEEGILNCSNEGDCPSPRGDNHKRVIIHWKFLKIFSRTSRPLSIKLVINHPWVKGILNCWNKGPGPFQRGDNHKNAKIGWVHLKIIFSKTTEPE
jgi:hypothetical protein